MFRSARSIVGGLVLLDTAIIGLGELAQSLQGPCVEGDPIPDCVHDSWQATGYLSGIVAIAVTFVLVVLLALLGISRARRA